MQLLATSVAECITYALLDYDVMCMTWRSCSTLSLAVQSLEVQSAELRSSIHFLVLSLVHSLLSEIFLHDTTGTVMSMSLCGLE